MIVLYFLFYYLTYWFDQHKERLSWSTPMERTAYAIGLITMSWFYAINQILNHIGVLIYHIPIWLYLLFGLAIIQIYKYVYIARNRYNLLASREKSPGNISNKTGVIISISFLFFSVILPFIFIFLFMPFGKHQLKNAGKFLSEYSGYTFQSGSFTGHLYL